ncbi:MAG TPA: phage Gp37/Gp68 family protein [Kofleriaceae bacterium]
MGDATSISWTDATWNPIRGCSRVSDGCRHCYAEAVAARFSGPGQPYEGLAKIGVRTGHHPKWTGEVRFIADHLADPLRWKKPRRIFVNSMSDLFHENLTNEQIAAVFAVMASAPQHTFQVLTKRARRMREWFEWADDLTPSALYGYAEHAIPTDDDQGRMLGFLRLRKAWPLPNVWLGVSVENQETAAARIPELLATPAAVRFLSCEPLLGPIDMPTVHVFGPNPTWSGPRIHWAIAGCESGPGARSCNVEWLRSLRDQCADAGVAFFLKQARAVPACIPAPDDADPSTVTTLTESGQRWIDIVCAGDGSRAKARGVIELPYLDGKQHAAFPEIQS